MHIAIRKEESSRRIKLEQDTYCSTKNREEEN